MWIIKARVSAHVICSLVHVRIRRIGHIWVFIIGWIDSHHKLLLVVAVWRYTDHLIITGVHLVEVHLLLVHSEWSWASPSASITRLPAWTR